jgi:hypothetical protein
MLADLVIDTNVLMHADDPRQAHQAEAQALLQDLLAGRTVLCVDDGFDTNESKNRSLIGGEYFERLTAAHTATAIIAQLFGNGAVHFVSRSVAQAVKKSIEQSVRKKRDRTFLAVAHNSDGQVLCSHDYEDMQTKKRKFLKTKVGVDVLVVADVRTLL